jgi:hypothetical protein
MRRFNTSMLFLGGLLLAWLVWRMGVRELWHELALLGWGLIPLMFGEGVAEMIHTVGWRHCLSGPLRTLPWRRLFGIRMAGYAVNYLTPTAGMGGEVTKATLLAEHHPGPEAASGVLIGKVCFALAHLIFVVLGVLLLLWRVPLPGPLRLSMLVSGLILGGGMLVFLLLQKHGKLGAAVRWLAARRLGSRALQTAAREITSVDDTMIRFYRERPWDLVQAMAWHLAGYSVGIAQTWLFFRLLGHDATWSVAAGAWFLGMWFDLLTFAVPMNLGTLEGTRVVALQAVGYTAVMGMTYGLAIRLAQIFWSGFGLLAQMLMAPPGGRKAALQGAGAGIAPIREPAWVSAPRVSEVESDSNSL